jgi:diketogulonate reductase-like aldo/keto reductase
MAYSPLEQGRLLKDQRLEDISKEAGMSVAELSIAWTMRSQDVVSIPKASSLKHVEQNINAWNVSLPNSILSALDKAFEPPMSKKGLDVL